MNIRTRSKHLSFVMSYYHTDMEVCYSSGRGYSTIGLKGPAFGNVYRTIVGWPTVLAHVSRGGKGGGMFYERSAPPNIPQVFDFPAGHDFDIIYQL